MKTRLKKLDGSITGWIIFSGSAEVALTMNDIEIVDGDIIETTESTMDEIKVKRTRLLRETDWTQTIDSSLSAEKQAEFKSYRQLLKDIPQTYTNPDDVVFPEIPE